MTVAYVQEEWAEGGAGRAMAIYVTGTVLGGFSGRMITGLVVSWWNWHWAFVAIGALGALAAWVLQAWLPVERHFTARSPVDALLPALLRHLRNPRLLATFAAGFGVLFTLVATFTYVTFHLAAAPYHLGPLAISFLFFTYLIDRFGHRTALVAAMSAGIAGMLLTLVPDLRGVVAGLALCCSGVFVAQATATSFIGQATDHGRALAVGMYVTCYYVGGSAGAELPGFLWRFGGWTACVALVVLVQVLTIAVTWTGWRHQLRPTPAVNPGGPHA